MQRAQYIGKSRNRDGYTTNLFYKYRGHEYVITDYGWKGYSVTLAEQHRQEQERIDRIIEENQRPQTGKDFDIDEVFKIFWPDD